MKTKTLPILAFLSAVAALPLLPIRFELASSLIFATGLFSILVADYAAPARYRRGYRAAGATAAVRREHAALRLAA